jgi:transposase
MFDAEARGGTSIDHDVGNPSGRYIMANGQKGIHHPKRNPKHFTLAFKLHALRKLEVQKMSPTQVSNELGLDRNLLYSWRKKRDKLYAMDAQGKPRQLKYHSEVSLLKSALRRMTMERDILKKALTYFAKHERRGTNTSSMSVGRNPYQHFVARCR